MMLVLDFFVLFCPPNEEKSDFITFIIKIFIVCVLSSYVFLSNGFSLPCLHHFSQVEKLFKAIFKWDVIEFFVF